MLDFSDASFADFFASELNVNIDDQKYFANGGSKGKRLRYFLQTSDDATAVRTLTAIWEHRREYIVHSRGADPVSDAKTRSLGLISRLSGGTATSQAKAAQQAAAADRHTIAKFKAELIQVSPLAPQARGYAFEQFLRRLFDAFGLAAQEPFRLRGEQIDGSFQLASEIYLLETKWQGQPIGVTDLHTFHGKMEQNAAWTAGCLSATAGLLKRASQRSGVASASFALTASTCTRCSTARSHFRACSSARCGAPLKPGRRSFASATSFLDHRGE